MSESKSIHCTAGIKLTVRGRFVTASSAPTVPGIDTAIARTADNRLLLPFSAVKGKLREAFDDCGQTEFARHWLGPRQETDMEPQRGRLRFSDFVGKQLDAYVPTETRIAMDVRRGSAQQGQLQEYESPLAIGETDTLTGTIRFLASGEFEARETIQTLVAGLRMVPQFGSNRTVGFGQLVGVESTEPSFKNMLGDDREESQNNEGSVAGVAKPGEDGVYRLILTPEVPFCVSKHKVSENIFESERSISGSVIKGVVASMLREVVGLPPGGPADENTIPRRPWQTLATHLHHLRFTTAMPMPRGGAELPVVPPSTLAKASDLVERDGYAFRDVAKCPRPCLLGDSNRHSAPSFWVDWKDRDDVDRAFNQVKLDTELRVRTAIDGETRRASSTQLFAYELIRPDNLQWVCEIHLEAIPEDDRDEVRRVLEMLICDGIWGIGKTKTYAKARWAEPKELHLPKLAQPKSQASGELFITLQSPALLHDPTQAHFQDLDPGESRGQALHNAYADYWNQVSGGELRLIRFFASQTLAGGDYIGHRFQGAKSPDDYRPYVLTDPGSVFVLQATGDDGKQKVQCWRRKGLPVSPHIKGPTDDEPAFFQCPYRREEGFGQIAIDMAVHDDLAPEEDEKTEIDQDGETES